MVADRERVVVEDDDYKEIYAHFGLAYYMAECVHRGLVNLVAFRSGTPGKTVRAQVEEQFARAEGMLMGELVPLANDLAPALRDEFAWVLKRRNYLAHGFWYEHAHEMLSPDGRDGLVRFLRDSADRMRSISQALDGLMDEYMEAHGCTHLFEQAFAEAWGRPPEPSIQRHLLRVGERLRCTDAWLLPAEGTLTCLVLRDEQGALWQPMEKGLGWYLLDGPKREWRQFKALQKYLPTGIVGRPKNAKPWDYVLHVSSGALLRVARDEQERICVTVQASTVNRGRR